MSMEYPFGDWSYQQQHFQEATYMVANHWCRPSVLFKPRLFVDGNQYCALYGEDLMSGCAGFGSTAADAMADFDHNWGKQKLALLTCPRCKQSMDDVGSAESCRDLQCPIQEPQS